ncbi:MAG: hypothetical protein HIU92_15790 [Proteobacteria bacterium]|nr:hypothetical protein [Pseudomonadota bacterium]
MSENRVMGTLRLIWDEVWGLFVDDGVFAGAIVVWVVIGWRVLPFMGLRDWLPAVVFFAGLAVILSLGALRAASQRGT